MESARDTRRTLIIDQPAWHVTRFYLLQSGQAMGHRGSPCGHARSPAHAMPRPLSSVSRRKYLPPEYLPPATWDLRPKYPPPGTGDRWPPTHRWIRWCACPMACPDPGFYLRSGGRAGSHIRQETVSLCGFAGRSGEESSVCREARESEVDARDSVANPMANRNRCPVAVPT